jgi:hypothetical protein
MRPLALQCTFACKPGNSSVTAERNFTKGDIWGGGLQQIYVVMSYSVKTGRGRGVGAGSEVVILYADLHMHGDKYLSE